MRTKGFIWMAAAILACLTPVAAKDLPEGLEVGPIQYFPIGDSPFSGPVEVIANTNHPTAARGTLADVFLAVQNHSNDATVSVNIDLDLRYADGVDVVPFHLGEVRQHTLGPDEGVGFFIFFQVPVDAPLGTATFGVNAVVGRVTGGDDRHSDNPNPMVASDSVEFEVLP